MARPIERRLDDAAADDGRQAAALGPQLLLPLAAVASSKLLVRAAAGRQPGQRRRGAATRPWLQPPAADRLVRSGSPHGITRTVWAGGRMIEVNYMMITAAGRRAIEG
jgi:hypothetical protein